MSQKATAVKRAQQSEARPHQLGQEVFKTILSEDVDWKPFPAFPPSVRVAVGAMIILPGNTPHFHWAKSGEYVTHASFL